MPCSLVNNECAQDAWIRDAIDLILNGDYGDREYLLARDHRVSLGNQQYDLTSRSGA